MDVRSKRSEIYRELDKQLIDTYPDDIVAVIDKKNGSKKVSMPYSDMIPKGNLKRTRTSNTNPVKPIEPKGNNFEEGNKVVILLLTFNSTKEFKETKNSL